MTPSEEQQHEERRAGMEDIRVGLAKMDGKLDAVMVSIAGVAAAKDDHEQRIRQLEAQPVVPPPLDQRVQALELRPTISPKQLWAALISAITLFVLLAPYISNLIHATENVQNP